MWSIVLYSVLLTFVFAKERESRIVQISQGPVRGYKNEEYGIFEFHNIPYATGPTGPNRFKPPLPPPEWTEIFEAEDKVVICPQKDFSNMVPKNAIELEDCLIANLYVPANRNKDIPVVVYVPGGAYMGGFGNMFPPRKFVASKDVLVVTFNYRVGAHGFLCLGTEDIPGNAGMKDQVALLRWVKRNIASFGGNPDNITIAGYSAGSSAVDLLMISKITKGLFTKVIPESGANTASFSIQRNPLQNAKQYAKLLNFENVDDVYALEDFFKNISVQELYSPDLWYSPFSFLVAPCVERKTQGESFLDDSPVNILKSGDYVKLPMLYGFAHMEGLLRIPLFNFYKDDMNKNFSKYLPDDLQFENEEEKENLAKKVKEFYFGDKPVGPETILAFIDYFSDVIFAYPTLRSVKLQVNSGNKNIYLYEYSYTDESVPIIPHTNVRGATHCSQTLAVHSLPHEDFIKTSMEFTDQYLKMTDIMRTIWHSFITTGNPIPPNSDLPAWPPAGADGSPHMSLNQTIELRGPLLQERVNFWHEIYDKYYAMPIPPPTPPPRRSEL